MVLQIIFWVLLILCFVGVFVREEGAPLVNRGRWVVALILILILGLKVFGGLPR